MRVEENPPQLSVVINKNASCGGRILELSSNGDLSSTLAPIYFRLKIAKYILNINQ